MLEFDDRTAPFYSRNAGSSPRYHTADISIFPLWHADDGIEHPLNARQLNLRTS